jgi:hypothetical protein
MPGGCRSRTAWPTPLTSSMDALSRRTTIIPWWKGKKLRLEIR